MLSEKYKCDQPGKTEFLVAPLDNGHFITGIRKLKFDAKVINQKES